MFNIRRLINASLVKRFYSNRPPARHILEHLKERSLIRVAGQDAKELLQGLITNDINHLGQQSGGSMYTMFLNTKGRVLYDAIIYRSDESDIYFLECDTEVVGPLQRHLKVYRIKRKVDIESLDTEYSVYALFDVNSLKTDKDSIETAELDGIIVPCDKLRSTLPETSTSTKTFKELLIFKDPRVVELGSRIISKRSSNVKEQLQEIVDITDPVDCQESYKAFRYSLGVSEGVIDLPPGNCFPLEANCDYLHGISFHKGCYIGQELTARTHHTGVVRKRIMPLHLTKKPTKLPVDNIITHENVNLGRLRGVEGNAALALLRISQALDFGEILLGNGIAQVKKPSWWPVEAAKTKVNVQKG